MAVRCSSGYRFVLTSLTLHQIISLVYQPTAGNPTGTQCNVFRYSSCVCDTPEGIIDLTALGNGDGTSARQVVEGGGNEMPSCRAMLN